MSTRQKSFFDQPAKARPFRTHWKRTNSANDASRTHPPPAKDATPRPPIAASSQSRNKLKAFQFVEGKPTEPAFADPADKENEDRHSMATASEDGKAQQRTPQKDCPTPQLLQWKTFPPSTPSTRLPLADLIGCQEEDTREGHRKDASPEEMLYWQHNIPSSNPGATTPAPLMGRKRARSSSPVGGSQEIGGGLQGKGLDIQNAQTNQKTPQADPAANLWSRYATNAGVRATPLAKRSGVLANIITDSSPRSSAMAGSVSGLRRWASCGLEWPMSRTKRRKTTGVFRDQENQEQQTDDVFELPTIDEPDRGKSKFSKVGLLVERIQETLAKPPKQNMAKGPSSSSPLPDAVPFPVLRGTSLIQRLPRIPETGILGTGKDVDAEPTTKETLPPSSSDFGDVDIDLDMVEAMAASGAISATVATNADAIVSHSASPPQSPSKRSTSTNKQSLDTDEEYGLGDDEETFAADLENVASLYDSCSAGASRPTSAVASASLDRPLNGSANRISFDASDDEFGNGEIDDEQLVTAATQAIRESCAGQANKSQPNFRAIQRYLVVNVIEGQYQTDRGQTRQEKTLVLEEEKTTNERVVSLRQSWFDTPAVPGDYVHVFGRFSVTGHCIIDDAENMLILHPDHLISATVVGDSFGCTRRAVLQDRIKATSKASPPQLYGTILHELIQEALKVNRWDSSWLEKTIESIIPKHYETLLEIGLSVQQALEHLRSRLPEMQGWAKTFMRSKPIPAAVINDRGSKRVTMSINKLLDVEEHVWSPAYGLKGNIDATVQVEMHDESGEKTLTVPFEVKTGKNSQPSHRAQTALYTLLLSDRYDVNVFYGILYYMESSEISRIPAIRNELVHLIMKRNEIACYVRDKLDLPPMLKDNRLCGNCYAQKSCFLYHKLAEDGSGEALGPKAKVIFDNLVCSLKPKDQDFFRRWETLLTKEESEMVRSKRELWTMLSTEREKLGRAFSRVVVEPGSALEDPDAQKINRFHYTFLKDSASPGFSFTESQLTVNDPVVVSDEDGHFALAMGYVTAVKKHRITVAVDRRLHNARTKQPGFDPATCQTFAGIMEMPPGDIAAAQSSQSSSENPILYRLDKDEFSNGMAAVRNNLIQIMDDGVYKARQLRALIVDGEAPRFKPASHVPPYATEADLAMNSDQKAAVAKVMSAEDYALVLGMPGTGKTTTISHIIRSLVNKGKSVLLTSYTHSAVDNILLKIKDLKVLRLGPVSRIHPEVQDFALLAAEPPKNLEELERTWMEPLVVATTCLSINHPLFSRRIFDYCIVDEASQITLPVCLGPIRMANTFVLVGDHNQLPPLVQNREAMAGGLDISLFKLLSDRHPQAVVNLEHQYRMCADIMLLSNQLVYHGSLKCGNSDVANRSLFLPNIAALDQHHSNHRQGSHQASICSGLADTRCYLMQALRSETKVLFLNTDTLCPCPDSPSLENGNGLGGSRVILNSTEARVITQLASSLLSTGLDPSELGVVTFYRSQLALLRSSHKHKHQGGAATSAPPVEFHTADKFQGRDKEVVLVSCVRSNPDAVVGDLLKDWRRINVAVTRARSKLLIVGSKRTLSKGNELLASLVGICESKGWVRDLSEADLEGHWFEDVSGTWASQQASSQLQVTAADSNAQPKTIGGIDDIMEEVLEEVSKSQNFRSPKNTRKCRAVLSPRKMGGPTNRKAHTQGLKPKPLSPTKSAQNRMKVPKKVGKIGPKALLGSKSVLRDIVHDAL